MNDTGQDLTVFIDLGFVLLVGFLILVETTPIESVALPGGDDTEITPPEDDRTVYEVTFDDNLNFVVLHVRLQAELCSFAGSEALVACMGVLADRSEDSVFVLTPRGLASVQQLVTILDSCVARDWSCTVRS